MVWERSARAWSDSKIPGGGAPPISPQRYHGLAHTKGLGLPGLGLVESLPGLPSHGVAVVLFFQLYQHLRETGGGPGVKGNIPQAWLRLEVGHHSCAWPGVGSSNQLFAWLWLAQLSSAWRGWSGGA